MASSITVISGPSGVGKGTLIAALLQRLPDARLAVSATTRPPRRSEQHGREYYFVSEEEFAAAESDGRLIESATYAGHRYGTFAGELTIAPHTIIECDVRGVEQLRPRLSEARYAFIAPPSMEKLAERLRSRGTETEEQIARRIAHAREEVAAAPGLYDEVIINDDLSAATERLLAFVSMRTGR
jgi:guanylate kinase